MCYNSDRGIQIKEEYMKNKRINLVVIFLMVITLIMATAISASAATVKINKKTVKKSEFVKK